MENADQSSHTNVRSGNVMAWRDQPKEADSVAVFV